jgi:hypothetical protein
MHFQWNLIILSGERGKVCLLVLLCAGRKASAGEIGFYT